MGFAVIMERKLRSQVFTLSRLNRLNKKINELKYRINNQGAIVTDDDFGIINEMDKLVGEIHKQYQFTFRQFEFVKGELLNVKYNFQMRKFQLNRDNHRHMTLKWDDIKLLYRIADITDAECGVCVLPDFDTY